MGIGARIAEPGQPALPVRREQPELIPALGAPALPDTAALEHDMIEAEIGQATAHGQSGLSSANHQRIDPLHDGPRVSWGSEHL